MLIVGQENTVGKYCVRLELQKKIKELFKLKEVIAIPSVSNQAVNKTNVGEAIALYLENIKMT